MSPKIPKKTCVTCGGEIFILHKEAANYDIRIIKRFEHGGKMEVSGKDLCLKCAASLVEEFVSDWYKLRVGEMSFDTYHEKYSKQNCDTCARYCDPRKPEKVPCEHHKNLWGIGDPKIAPELYVHK